MWLRDFKIMVLSRARRRLPDAKGRLISSADVAGASGLLGLDHWPRPNAPAPALLASPAQPARGLEQIHQTEIGTVTIIFADIRIFLLPANATQMSQLHPKPYLKLSACGLMGLTVEPVVTMLALVTTATSDLGDRNRTWRTI
jgi:hypothetical protein